MTRRWGKIYSALAVLMLFSISHAEQLIEIQLLKISPQDERAIIRTPDGKMQMIKVGDVLRVPGSGLRVKGEKYNKNVAGSALRDSTSKNMQHNASSELRVVEIAEGRVVLEEKKGEEVETVIIRLEDGKQKVERVKKAGGVQPLMYKAR